MVVGEEAVLTEEMNSRVVWGVEWRGNTDLVVGVGFEEEREEEGWWCWFDGERGWLQWWKARMGPPPSGVMGMLEAQEIRSSRVSVSKDEKEMVLDVPVAWEGTSWVIWFRRVVAVVVMRVEDSGLGGSLVNRSWKIDRPSTWSEEDQMREIMRVLVGD